MIISHVMKFSNAQYTGVQSEIMYDQSLLIIFFTILHESGRHQFKEKSHVTNYLLKNVVHCFR